MHYEPRASDADLFTLTPRHTSCTPLDAGKRVDYDAAADGAAACCASHKDVTRARRAPARYTPYDICRSRDGVYAGAARAMPVRSAMSRVQEYR